MLSVIKCNLFYCMFSLASFFIQIYSRYSLSFVNWVCERELLSFRGVVSLNSSAMLTASSGAIPCLISQCRTVARACDKCSFVRGMLPWRVKWLQQVHFRESSSRVLVGESHLPRVCASMGKSACRLLYVQMLQCLYGVGRHWHCSPGRAHQVTLFFVSARALGGRARTTGWVRKEWCSQWWPSLDYAIRTAEWRRLLLVLVHLHLHNH